MIGHAVLKSPPSGGLFVDRVEASGPFEHDLRQREFLPQEPVGVHVSDVLHLAVAVENSGGAKATNGVRFSFSSSPPLAAGGPALRQRSA
jgi:hypothetical protein